MKLHLLQCGTIRTKRHLIEGGPVGNESFEVPVPFFLIEHEMNRVLFDAGNSRIAIHAPVTGDYIPVMTEADYVVAQLASLGLTPSDVTHIVLSHLHGDHAGGLEAFRDIPCYIQREEIQHTGGSSPTEQYLLSRQLLDGDHDLFGDGRMRILATPGHSPGHQSLLLRLDSGEEVLLAADAAYTRGALEQYSLPTTTFDRTSALETFEKINAMRCSGVRIICGHELGQLDG
ncbi:N-acyl homoserine lactonase family protein [Ruficoccus amylovorans]|uniref:N-acyl homoserine lactonase family protein n=1 Tax=Ruficoccus amylovorans TaxID=1804625 RepID=A0A842HJQ3_9BACT|nr:N-acyl homoserine lactonase family protein [Ruficoccus amylovorans]MBC2595874.1 N-acyl homoserine lactonase family protein [Ruficoccus amylovorans]